MVFTEEAMHLIDDDDDDEWFAYLIDAITLNRVEMESCFFYVKHALYCFIFDAIQICQLR